MKDNKAPLDSEDEEGIDDIEEYDKQESYEGLEVWDAYDKEYEKIKSRFLVEFDKLIYRGDIKSARQYANLLNVHCSFISQVKTDRYKVNLRTLWITKRIFPDFDVEYVLWGTRSQLRPMA